MPKSIRVRLPTFNSQESFTDEYDIDKYVENVPTIVQTTQRPENDNHLPAIHIEDEDDPDEMFAEDIFKTIQKAAVEEKASKDLLEVPPTKDGFPDEFASYVQFCRTMMKEIQERKSRDPIKLFIESIPPKEEEAEVGVSKKRRKRRRRKGKSFKGVQQKRKSVSDFCAEKLK